MSASTMTSAVSVLVLGVEILIGPHLHIPHMAEKRAGGKACAQGRALVRREAVVSLDASRTPAMLLRCGDISETH